MGANSAARHVGALPCRKDVAVVSLGIRTLRFRRRCSRPLHGLGRAAQAALRTSSSLNAALWTGQDHELPADAGQPVRRAGSYVKRDKDSYAAQGLGDRAKPMGWTPPLERHRCAKVELHATTSRRDIRAVFNDVRYPLSDVGDTLRKDVTVLAKETADLIGLRGASPHKSLTSSV